MQVPSLKSVVEKTKSRLHDKEFVDTCWASVTGSLITLELAVDVAKAMSPRPCRRH